MLKFNEQILEYKDTNEKIDNNGIAYTTTSILANNRVFNKIGCIEVNRNGKLFYADVYRHSYKVTKSLILTEIRLRLNARTYSIYPLFRKYVTEDRDIGNIIYLKCSRGQFNRESPLDCKISYSRNQYDISMIDLLLNETSGLDKCNESVSIISRLYTDKTFSNAGLAKYMLSLAVKDCLRFSNNIILCPVDYDKTYINNIIVDCGSGGGVDLEQFYSNLGFEHIKGKLGDIIFSKLTNATPLAFTCISGISTIETFKPDQFTSYVSMDNRKLAIEASENM